MDHRETGGRQVDLAHKPYVISFFYKEFKGVDFYSQIIV